jgi:hypothetical protein
MHIQAGPQSMPHFPWHLNCCAAKPKGPPQSGQMQLMIADITEWLERTAPSIRKNGF